MEKIIYAVMATAAMLTCVFAQQTENSNETTIDLKIKKLNGTPIKRDILTNYMTTMRNILLISFILLSFNAFSQNTEVNTTTVVYDIGEEGDN